MRTRWRRSAARSRTRSDAASFSATYTRTLTGQDGTDRAGYDVVRNASGSYVLTREDGLRTVAYDTATGTRWERTTGFDGSVVVTEDTGTAAGAPDPSGAEPTLPDTELGTALRALSTVTDREAESTQVDGRAVWRMEGPLERDGGRRRPGGARGGQGPARPDERRRCSTETGWSARCGSTRWPSTWPRPGRSASTRRATEPQRVDHGFRLVTLREAAAAVGNRPLATDLPAGWVRARRHRAPRGRRDRVAPLPARGAAGGRVHPTRGGPGRARTPSSVPSPSSRRPSRWSGARSATSRPA